MTVNGVRSSWLISASSGLRWRSSVSSRAAVVSEAARELVDGGGGRDPGPTRTV